jgi:HEAT repeat protein
MDYSELKYCIEVLKKEPPIFFSTRSYRNKIECLNRIKAEARPSNISELFPLLKTGHSATRIRVSEVILFFVLKLKSQNQLYGNLKYIQIERSDIDFYKKNFSAEALVWILGIASLNHNGHIREKAIEELMLSRMPEAIRFIIFRLGDWVKQVREAAQVALKSFLTHSYIESLTKELAVIDSLKGIGRTDLSSVREQILQFVCSVELTEQLYTNLKISDKAKLLFLKNYVRINGFHSSYFRLLSTDASFLVRKESIKYLAKLSDQNERRQMLVKLLLDRSVHVRMTVLNYLTEIDDDLEKIIVDLLSDVSSSVRDVSRFLLKSKNLNYPNIYRERIQSNENDYSSILGLGETGSQEDVSLLEKLLSKESVKVKLACLQSLKSLNISTAKKYCLDLFIHPSNKIRKKSIEVLAKTWNSETQEKAEQVYPTADHSQKKTILDLYNKVGGWVAVSPFILAVSESDVGLQNTAWFYLKRWRDRITNVFTAPPEIEIRKAIAYYEQTDTSKLDLSPSRAVLWREVRYRLR